MSKINLKNDIWIEGFDSEEEYNIRIRVLDKMFWHGKTLWIPEEIAKKCVKTNISININNAYIDYTEPNSKILWYFDAKDSIQSACSQEYCVIYKSNI